MSAVFLLDLKSKHRFRTVSCPHCGAAVIRLTRPYSTATAVVDAETVSPADHAFNFRRHRLHFRVCRAPRSTA